MHRRRLLQALGSGSLTALAGCADTSSSQSPEETPTPAEELTHPPGFSPEGIADVTRAVSSHTDYLTSLSNYTGEWVLQTINSDGERHGDPTEMIVNANPVDQRVFLNYLDHANDVEVFYNDTYYEYNVEEDTVIEGESARLFTTVEKSYEGLAFYGVNLLLSSVFSIVQVEPGGEIDVQGSPGTRYDVVGVSEEQRNQSENVTYSGASGEILVTEGGGIREIEYTPEFESENTALQTVSYTIEQIGDTSVDTPDWLP